MSIIKFVQNLVPNFERARILEDIHHQIEYIDQTVIPNYRNAGRLMGNKPLASAQAREFAGGVFFAIPEYKSRGLFVGLAEYFSQINESIQALEKLVPDVFSADVTKETLSFQKATILKYLESTRFLSRYAAGMLGLILAAETSEKLKKDTDAYLIEQLTKVERNWLEINAQRFIDTLKALNRKPRDIITAVNSIPEVTADPDKERILNQTIGANKLDPLKLGLLSPETSFIYSARQYIAEWQHDNYKAGVEEARVLELRIADLKYALDGKEDAATQRVLDVTKGRLDKLKAKLKDYEDQLA